MSLTFHLNLNLNASSFNLSSIAQEVWECTAPSVVTMTRYSKKTSNAGIKIFYRFGTLDTFSDFPLLVEVPLRTKLRMASSIGSVCTHRANKSGTSSGRIRAGSWLFSAFSNPCYWTDNSQ
uniref:AlNc14C30G2832 protein n=1 Tax=Albugo laibachii Nc14 TaxID=890382 RepID=F0W7M7_9STRA|nr:AlNc14C30G2832 [Albugo laibachii Nc14]|eukprot:CCA17128.1 AlNc14C30G2832 [Albugo laibachii Nc14]